ncbi:MAG: hypothetical protein HC822_13785 [Oscillochloris sp.]|nr:hypothetical protein [Oscillochloris sp.]
MTTTGETAVQINSTEAQRLYQRGIAAARGGQKRVAAGLLTRAVQLDPSNERAWLWLSGVLDSPQHQAFCLQAALKLNPQNEHAQRGLRVLHERHQLSAALQAAPGLTMPGETQAQPAATTTSDRNAESWWVSWRRNRHEMSRARLILWMLPLVLVVLALVLYESAALAIERNQASTAAAVPTAEVLLEPTPILQPTVEPILEAEPLAVVESLALGYLAALEPLRIDLRTATEAYRTTTSQPGGASVGHVAATQRLRERVDQALTTMDTLRPPPTLQQAHDDYRRGLELEIVGLDAVMEFYGSYDVAHANRAAMHFQEARAYIDRARAMFAAQARHLSELSAASAHTPR